MAPAVEIEAALHRRPRHSLDMLLPRSPAAGGRPARLAQVVGNLLKNAAKYTEAAAASTADVALRGRGGPAGARHGHRHRRGHAAPHLRVVHQVQGPASRSQGGLGIGLTLVKNLVEMHGGSVEATERGLGHGSEFVVRLPLLREALAPARRDASNRDPQGTRPEHPDRR